MVMYWRHVPVKMEYKPSAFWLCNYNQIVNKVHLLNKTIFQKKMWTLVYADQTFFVFIFHKNFNAGRSVFTAAHVPNQEKLNLQLNPSTSIVCEFSPRIEKVFFFYTNSQKWEGSTDISQWWKKKCISPPRDSRYVHFMGHCDFSLEKPMQKKKPRYATIDNNFFYIHGILR